MDSKLTKLCSISLLLMLFCSPSLADSSIYNTPETICNNYTRFPKFCKSSLPYNKPGTIHDYAKISLQQSLSHANRFLGIVQHYSRLPSTMSKSTLLALEDCLLLSQQNIDYLSNILETLKSSNDALQSYQAEDLQTLLSATLTNLETCSDGLMLASDSSIKNAIIAPISNGTMHCSVSLALFTHGWPHATKKGRFLTERSHVFSNLQSDGRKGLPLIMSSEDKQRYESVSRRRVLLPSSNYTGNVTVRQFVVVDPNGAWNFTTINDAIAAAPNNSIASKGYFVIYVVAGVYNEYVNIASNKKYLMMIGEGINKTVITGNQSVDDGWTTYNSATFIVVGQGFVAVNLTVQNTAGAIKHQAVAVRNGADMSTFYKCSFEGYQDTLYTHSLRQFYRECDVYGTIDYIFGNAAVVLQNCNIYSRLPLKGQFNTLTAQGRTDPNQNTGTSIQNCNIKAANDLALNLSTNGTTKSYLGRPWKEYSRTVVMKSYIDSLIDKTGWSIWSGDFALSTLYYAEFNNTGPGSDTADRVTWLGYHVINESDAVNFTVSNFIVGAFWLPATGVPYLVGLY